MCKIQVDNNGVLEDVELRSLEDFDEFMEDNPKAIIVKIYR